MQRGGPVQFKDGDTARYFCRAVAAPGALRGTGFDPPERWIARANAWATATPGGAQRIALIVKTFRKGKGARFDAVPCQRCGALLTNPESIAAGVGPECMDKAK